MNGAFLWSSGWALLDNLDHNYCRFVIEGVMPRPVRIDVEECAHSAAYMAIQGLVIRFADQLQIGRTGFDITEGGL